MKTPLISLRSIYLLWHPQTAASFEERAGLLDVLRERDPETSWLLMLSIIPGSHDVASPTSTPRWRPWVPQIKGAPSFGELATQIEDVTDRLLRDVGPDPARWKDLVGIVDSLPRPAFDAVVSRLEQGDVSRSDRDGLMNLRGSLRKIVSHHWKFPDAAWALPDFEVQRLFNIYQQIAPDDVVDRHAWLFTMFPDMPVRNLGENYDESNQAAVRARTEAIQEIASEGGLAALKRTVATAESPWTVGNALGFSGSPIGTEFFNETVGTDDSRAGEAALGFLAAVISVEGPSGVTKILDTKTKQWNASQRAAIYLGLPFDSDTWDRLNSERDEIRERYWASLSPFGRGQLDPKLTRGAATGFLDWGQAAKAVHFLALYPARENDDLAIRALRQLAEAPPAAADWRDLGYQVTSLLGFLGDSDHVNEGDLAELEWTYLPVLVRVQYGYRPPTLDRALADDPSFFVRVLGSVYRREDDSSRPDPTDEEKIRAQAAFELLHNWSRLPGLTDESLNLEALRAWVLSVREMAAEAGLGKVADTHIGQILSFSPDGGDNLWPHEAVRQLLEDLANEQIERGFEIQVMNSRGLTTRGYAEGGEQERMVAARYRQHSVALIRQWPRAGTLLSRIANDFESDARRWDDRAEVDRNRFE